MAIDLIWCSEYRGGYWILGESVVPSTCASCLMPAPQVPKPQLPAFTLLTLCDEVNRCHRNNSRFDASRVNGNPDLDIALLSSRHSLLNI